MASAPPSAQPSHQVEVVVLDDSDDDSPILPVSSPKRPRPVSTPTNVSVIDVDDDEQLQTLERLHASRILPTPPHITNSSTVQLAGAANPQRDIPGQMHFGRGGEAFTVATDGRVRIVDSDEEDGLINTRILGMDEGLQIVREMQSDLLQPQMHQPMSGHAFYDATHVNGTVPTHLSVPQQSSVGPLMDFGNAGQAPYVTAVQPNVQVPADASVLLNDTFAQNGMPQPDASVLANPIHPPYSAAMLQPPTLPPASHLQFDPTYASQSAPMHAPSSAVNGTNSYIAQPTQQVHFAPTSQVNPYVTRPDFRAVTANSSAQIGPEEFEVKNYHFSSSGGGSSAAPSGDALSAKELKKILKQNELTADATEECDTPVQLRVELMAHQKRALAWMMKRERPMADEEEDLVVVDEECLGGILADDQGLGKTLSMIALLISNPPEDSAQAREENTTSSDSDEDDLVDDSSIGESTEEPWGTLIVCPVSLMNQWKEELQTRIRNECRPSVYLYHGSHRTDKVARLQKYDVVITTYSVLAHEYPKVQKDHAEYAMRKQEKLPLPTRNPGAICKVNWHRIVLDEAQYVKNRNTDAWSAVMSLTARKRWCLTGTPIQNSVDDLYALFCFIRYQFVPNYETWNTKWKKKLEHPEERIRTKAFKQFQTITGVVLLRRTKRDAISGKPLISLPSRTVQVDSRQFADNDEAAIYIAVAQRSVLTFNKFLAEGTLNANYSTVLLALLRMRQACNHPFLIQYTQMQNRGGTSVEMNDKYETTYSQEDLEEALELMGSGHSLVELVHESARDQVVKMLEPPLKCTNPAPDFHCTRCGSRGEWANGSILGCGHILCETCCGSARQYRQCLVCNFSINGVDELEAFINADHIRREVHAHKILGKRVDSSVQLSRAELKELMEEKIRQKLRDGVLSGRSSEVSDVGDSDSQEDGSRGGKTKKRKRVNGKGSDVNNKARRTLLDAATRQQGEKLLTALSQHSTKVMVILEDLDKTRRTRPLEKTLIFSQWTSFLDILEFHVRMHGHGVCRLDGSMQAHMREKNLREFRESGDKNVFLISLSAGGTGLNLTVSNRVILSDVWWNPAAEEQAIDRVHRIGQTREVFVKRFRMLGTVEDRIYKICERKKQMADGTLGVVGKQNFGRTKMSMQELVNLFSGAAEDVMQFGKADSAAMAAASNILRHRTL